MKCEEVEELAGAYALEALPAETLREVREHLASCRPGQSDVEFYVPPGEYEVQVMDRSVYLRDAQSFRHTPLGKQDIEVKEGKENEFTIEVEAAPSTKELEGKVAGDK